MKISRFMKAAGIRAVKTMAQTAVSLLGVGSVMSDVDWLRIVSASALAGILSMLTSISTGLPEVSMETKAPAEPEAPAEK